MNPRSNINRWWLRAHMGSRSQGVDKSFAREDADESEAENSIEPTLSFSLKTMLHAIADHKIDLCRGPHAPVA